MTKTLVVSLALACAAPVRAEEAPPTAPSAAARRAPKLRGAGIALGAIGLAGLASGIGLLAIDGRHVGTRESGTINSFEHTGIAGITLVSVSVVLGGAGALLGWASTLRH